MTGKQYMLKADDVLEVLLYCCAMWSPTKDKLNALGSTHNRFLLRCIGAYEKKQ